MKFWLWSRWLPAVSLLLLCGFLLWWLGGVYQTEKVQLKGQLGLHLERTLNQIEDSYIQDVIQYVVATPEGDAQLNLKTRKRILRKRPIRDVNLTLRLDSTAFQDTNNRQLDTIIFIKNIDPENAPFHRPIAIQTDSLVEQLQQALSQQRWPHGDQQLTLVDLADTNQIAGLRSDTIRNPLLGLQPFALQMSPYQSLLLRRMLPQIIAALLLFGFISIAFYTIRRSLRQQQEMLRLKNDFIANITHELKTPITTVGVALEALDQFDAIHDPVRSRDYLQIGRQELDRLSLLVDRVLNLSQFEQGHLQLDRGAVDLKTLVEEVLRAMRVQFEKRRAQVNFQTEGTDFQLSGDRLHLLNVVYNLVDNALKYSPDTPVIDIRLQRRKDVLQLQVGDQGIGIAPAYQARLFDKFFRVPDPQGHRVKGHGLGLSYVARVIREHGGQIAVDSEPGRGSNFIVSLPYQ